MGMMGLKGISNLEKRATLREYAQAIKRGDRKLAQRIRDANGKWITRAEFNSAEV